jgi:hypothetical protein
MRLTVATVVTCFLAAAALTGSDVAGRWKGTVHGDQGDFTLVFNFTVQGDTLGGTVEGPGGMLDITDGTIKGDVITFNAVLDSANTITYEGKVDGDKIQMKSHGPWGDSKFTVERVKQAE